MPDVRSRYGFQTPLRRVHGLGPARSGTSHFWQMRVTSVLLVPLTLAFVFIVLSLLGRSHSAAIQVLANPFVTFTILAFLGVSLHHMWLGMREIIIDYVHDDNRKLALLIANACCVGQLPLPAAWLC